MVSFNKKGIITILVSLGLIIELLLSLKLAGQNQDIRKHAASSAVALSLYPVTETFSVNQTKTFNLIATFTGGSTAEKIDYFKTTLSFSPKYIVLPANVYVDTSSSGLQKIMRVDGPTAANGSGNIVIELGANAPGTGPSTNAPITIARITFKGFANTPSPQNISIVKTQIINNAQAGITFDTQNSKNGSYTVGGLAVNPTPTPAGSSSCPVPPGGCHYEGGNACTCGDLVCTTPAPTNPNDTSAPSETPVLPTLPSNNGQYTISVGDKQSLVINISTASGVPIRFKSKLENSFQNPDLYFKLRVIDELAFLGNNQLAGLNPPGISGGGTDQTGTGNTSQTGSGGTDQTAAPTIDTTGGNGGTDQTVAPTADTTGGNGGTAQTGTGSTGGGDSGTATGSTSGSSGSTTRHRPTPTPTRKPSSRSGSDTDDRTGSTRVDADIAAMDTCNNPAAGTMDFYIPVNSDTNGNYLPNPNGDPSKIVGFPLPSGVTAAAVSADGWVTLNGVQPGHFYTLILKGPKTRGVKVAMHVQFSASQGASQDFDWTTLPLQPGDLPDPNNNNLQQCTVNSVDWSLIQNRIGAQDSANTNICDVNYDGICNAGDVVDVIHTLSTKPDDDL